MTEPAKGNITSAVYISDTTWNQYYDPVSEKLKELEERIDAWQNKFEFVNVREE